MSPLWLGSGKLSRRVRTVATLFVGGALTVYVPVSAADADPERDSLFSEVQAARGGEVMRVHCMVCHGARLTGGGGSPTLQGPDFLLGWSEKTTTDLVEYIATKMPPGRGHSLTGQQYEDVSAYILSFNGFPAGKAPLSPANPKPIGLPPDAVE